MSVYNFNRMKFYVAGKWDDKPTARRVMREIRSGGHIVTHDWTTYEVMYTDEEERMSVCAAKDIEGVRDCNILVAIMIDFDYAYRGTYTEIGAAIALRKKVYIIGPSTTTAANNCFWHHPDIIHGDWGVEVDTEPGRANILLRVDEAT